MTNKIMRNNSLYNINQNKIAEDQLNNQMTNQSKIVRPSDDPVVAIRALRLRTNVTNITQYHDKNADDADKWLTVTQDALGTIGDVLNSLYQQATSASNKYLTSDDLEIHLTQMESLTDEFYASGNVDYAGRYVFSGYRTDTAITFSATDIAQMEKNPVSYQINEEMGYEDISTINYTNYDVLSKGLTAVGATADESYEQYVTNTDLYRFRLSYDALDDVTLSFRDANGKTLEVADPTTPGATVDIQSLITKYDTADEAYAKVASGDEKGIAYIPSTGELVFGKDVYDSFKEGDSFTITYDKSDWQEGDINPVHYFKCVETTQDGAGNVTSTISYNNPPEDQNIYYDVGYNQNIQVNTLTGEVFTHNVRRDMDDLQYCLKELKGIETTKSDIESKMAEVEEGSSEYEDYQKQLEAVDKAETYIRDSIQTKFENQITQYQNYIDDTNVAITKNATRGSRLDLITTRLENQKTTFKELQSNNEDIDVTEVAVELSSAELTYQAALMATSKIMQSNLMNYI
jgi:flagellar hook-associated protein 3 FlgL